MTKKKLNTNHSYKENGENKLISQYYFIFELESGRWVVMVVCVRVFHTF